MVLVEESGSFIVLEGVDGSGKSTQKELLIRYLEDNGIDWEYIHFPRYNGTVFGEKIAKYLRGDIEEHNPYYIATLYANDRYKTKSELEKWLSEEKVIICDRYVYSCLAYQGSQISEETSNRIYLSERERFLDWVWNYEFMQNKIPRPDIVFYLDATMDLIEESIRKKKKENRDYLDGGEDIFERVDFLEDVDKLYKEIFDGLKESEVVDYSKENGVKDVKEVNNQIINTLQREGIL